MLCAVCDSYDGRAVRRLLLSNSPTSGRLLVLRDALLGFLPGSMRTARLDSILG